MNATCLRGEPALSYKRRMAETTYFPRRLILGGAMISGVLLALAVHMLGARYGLDLGGLWRSDTTDFMPAGGGTTPARGARARVCGGGFFRPLVGSTAARGIRPPRRARDALSRHARRRPALFR